MYEDDSNLIGRRLRALRGKRSLAAVAELAGISKSYLSRLERGERPVDSRHLLERSRMLTEWHRLSSWAFLSRLPTR
ncbi:helix-turn-helix domain-containing protein [Solihabitans fulvus]|uniref:helix-turn-helix domain-containing protein n=1 Tax=Solihabitans fulvus TaxID=1892852 RepID=UPI001CB76240|nr:helix-turn-helix transcriptional regulator [Solihabitans fulvus]